MRLVWATESPIVPANKFVLELWESDMLIYNHICLQVSIHGKVLINWHCHFSCHGNFHVMKWVYTDIEILGVFVV